MSALCTLLNEARDAAEQITAAIMLRVVCVCCRTASAVPLPSRWMVMTCVGPRVESTESVEKGEAIAEIRCLLESDALFDTWVAASKKIK